MVVNSTAFHQVIEEFIPLNNHLGLKVENFDAASGRVVTRLEMRPEYIGNVVRNMLHGGIISFMIDATAGAAAMLSLEDISYLDKLATIDMRVDYLTPAKGQVLFTTSQVMRSGNRVVVVRSDVHDDLGAFVALGSNVFNVAR